MDVVDLHCDLLEYLAHAPGRDPYDEACCVCFPKLKQGHVIHQVTAIFCETKPGSTQIAEKQINWFHQIAQNVEAITLTPAFENASGFAEESEPLSVALKRLEGWAQAMHHIAYISLTWNGENRFGGGTGSNKGLKSDGKILIDWMATKGIPIDFSHTSDKLAEEILNYCDAQGLHLPVLASHSNFREICSQERNLPEWLAQELIRRKGVIGLNLFAPFIHKTDPTALIRHVEYGLSLGGHETLCFGADFFHASDMEALLKKHHCTTPYFPRYSNASCYPHLLEDLIAHLSLTPEVASQIAHHNALRFLQIDKR